MSRSQQLLELQRLDLQRDALVAELSSVVAKLKGNPTVIAARREVSESEQALAEVQPVLKDQNLERDGVKEHIAREEQKLYGGKVKAPKELQNYELEIASLKRHLAELDDAALETLLEHDEAVERLRSAEGALEEAQAAAATEQLELTERKRELTAAVRRIDADRAEFATAIPPADAQRYERIRKAKGGRAVAAARDGTCSACGMLLPRQDIDHVREGADLIPCPGCGRLLSA